MRFTLLTDGSSDRTLLPILRWLLGQHSARPFEETWADLGRLRVRPKGLAQRIAAAVDLYPCDLLFVHRDTEKQLRQDRVNEIHEALQRSLVTAPVVCVIPVRMQEAWLCFDLDALRYAAGCPNGRMHLSLPTWSRIEAEPDPKNLLYGLLRSASGLQGRRAKAFCPDVHVHRLAELINDFSPLRKLSAFNALEAELTEVLEDLGCLAAAAQIPPGNKHE